MTSQPDLETGVSVEHATHVKVGGRWERIVSTYGIDADGRLAKPSRGGFGVRTDSGRSVSMWDAELYGREKSPR